MSEISNQTTSNVIIGQAEGKTEVKRSVFIATAKEVHSEEEALAFLETMRKQYWDAKHNCYAYVIGSRGEIRRFSDDKEPSGTAGKPILEVLTGKGMVNTIVVVTRYFGGILLGTGGLVRAYSQATAEALQNADVYPVAHGSTLKVTANYADSGKIRYLAAQEGIPLLDIVYAEDVTFFMAVQESRTEEMLKKITEAASGAASATILDSIDFYMDGDTAKLYSFS